VILLLFVGVVVYYSIKDIYLSQIKDELLSNINIISLGLKKQKNLDAYAKEIKKVDSIRVTFIRDDGLVLGESDKDKEKMDNHRLRPEVIQARKTGIGSSIRHSHTLDKDLLYVAKRYETGGRVIYIRVAKEVKKIYTHILHLGLKVGVILILFFIILFYATYALSTQVKKEVDKITRFLVNLSKKKKSTYINSNFSKEFHDITRLLTKVSLVLAKRDKQKAKYTKKLKRANKQKDEILSAISHEFKNPITAINGYSKTLIEDKDINEAIRMRFLQKIYSNAERLSDLINTLRLALKLDNESIKLTFEECSVYDIAKDVIESLKLFYKDRDVVLTGDKETKVKADKVLLGVAITNLIENALKYSEDRVEVIVKKESITVKDSGVGINEKEIKNITKKFYRVSKNHWDNSLGLGLSIVSNITTLHNFKLKITSIKNMGSEFSIIFDSFKNE
jgi:signal transduction histidine kinase